jgi:hypothetical protein
MTRQELEAAVALATGESLGEIRRRGFGLVTSARIDFDPEPYDRPPQIVNWDEVDAGRIRLFP